MTREELYETLTKEYPVKTIRNNIFLSWECKGFIKAIQMTNPALVDLCALNLLKVDSIIENQLNLLGTTDKND